MFQLAITAISAGVTAYGAYKKVQAGKSSKSAANAAFEASQRAEALRLKQMTLDNQRRIRDVVRQGMFARSSALSAATAQGAATSSAFAGGEGQIVNSVGQRLQAQGENFQIGQGLFAANVDKMRADVSLGASRTDAAIGDSLFGLGIQGLSNARNISNNLSSISSSRTHSET